MYAAGEHSFVVHRAKAGLFTTSGSSVTAHRNLNAWRALGGPREEPPELGFAMAALLLGAFIVC